MTWYADEVIMLATPQILRAIASDSRLLPFAYHLTNPLEHRWHRPDVVHDVPAEGLVIIRPVCDAGRDGSESGWYREPVLDWHVLTYYPGLPLSLDPENVAKTVSLGRQELPPTKALAYLKQFSVQFGSPVIYYSCGMWGGAFEWEYAWVFDQSEVVLVRHRDEDQNASDKITLLEPGRMLQGIEEDPLVLALERLGLILPSGYFAPHTRSFPWDRYKMSPKRHGAIGS